MNIREALLAEHSKDHTMKIVEYIGRDAAKFEQVMKFFLGPTYRLSQRAAWVVNYCAEHEPQLVRPYFTSLVVHLERDDVHDAVRRNVARMLQFIEVPKRLRGRTFDACYKLVDEPHQPVAVRAFAMTVAAQIAKDAPELRQELRLIAQKHAPHTTIAFRKRAEMLFERG